ncbi:ParB/RepB/Spo0J family partition protein [Helicovermis profundi]|uniref:ParB/RepB/Spo0J family partition protein n=1 Tax=Helicovermis profundi TaxID=3065157 RepID=A0AAU9EVH0_9FIRM|nr:ParB/RepB/Spo0J family partition protein [Clostridia bacterium S502]
MKQKKALGRGLGALIPEEIKTALEPEGKIISISIDKIIANKDQPRKQFDIDKIDSLANSIKEHGVLQPIVVREENNKYKIIAGERRWRACKKNEFSSIPCIVKDYDDATVAEIALVENLQREDLNVLEEALAYSMLIKKYKFTQEQISKATSKSRSNIANILRLLKLDEKVRLFVKDGKISGGHARTLLMLDNVDKQIELANKIYTKGLSVRDTEKMVKKLIEANISKKKLDRKIDFELIQITEELESFLGTKVKITNGRSGVGKIEIEFYDDEDLARILEIMN